ncbi:nitrate reductase molybdenum cofactor assembly chaperone [Actinocorallia sp. A-T 12471]|uniref:nitrate reductase molybdenum cofactor assembly chaperone n=1 Tax=Actinocorallia sp. A-T 12471 TaxID=3089813 RepID=UPI0029CD2B92|nr:nitrate reductase molybdenum cofactor assembly chaperone [Actinocorallia sp. A-T 12471]MDX6742214.1 nitrate reductase molybdenum cofactor assembly chaperone [Actinocorallia sp. A-T 12471]
MRPKGPAPAEAAAAWQTGSVLLRYPEPELPGLVPELRDVVAGLPRAIAEPYGRFLDHVAATPSHELAVAYVETFDHRKRGCLYLSYYAYGDTRKRGMALLRFQRAYRAAGLVLTGEEIADHLPVVLEFAAYDAAGRALLLEHRAGLELLRRSLRESGSPWADVLDGVNATLPALTGRAADAVMRLAAEGPPDEEVGLPGYGPESGRPGEAWPSKARTPGPGERGPESGRPAPGPGEHGPVALPEPVVRGVRR